VHGGQRIVVSAPIDTLPIFVKAGAILPLGSVVESTEDKQTVAELRVYPGRDGEAQIYSDDGTTYAYETGKFEVTKLHWDDKAGKVTFDGPKQWEKPLGEVVKVVGR
jgi:alpha-D-xyloside xylohydrolase